MLLVSFLKLIDCAYHRDADSDTTKAVRKIIRKNRTSPRSAPCVRLYLLVSSHFRCAGSHFDIRPQMQVCGVFNPWCRQHRFSDVRCLAAALLLAWIQQSSPTCQETRIRGPVPPHGLHIFPMRTGRLRNPRGERLFRGRPCGRFIRTVNCKRHGGLRLGREGVCGMTCWALQTCNYRQVYFVVFLLCVPRMEEGSGDGTAPEPHTRLCC